MNKKIVVPKNNCKCDTNYTVALTPDAASMLKVLISQTSMNARQLASTIIIQAVTKDLITFEEEEE